MTKQQKTILFIVELLSMIAIDIVFGFWVALKFAILMFIIKTSIDIFESKRKTGYWPWDNLYF